MTNTPDPAEGSRNWTELYNIVDNQIDQTPMAWRVSPGRRPSDEYLAVNGFYGLIRAPHPEIDLRKQRAVMQPQSQWVRDDFHHTVTQGWIVVDLTPPEQAEVAAQQMRLVRTERNARLQATDYTQLDDIPQPVRAQWAGYRQLLRELPDTITDPFNVQWPAPPTPED